MGGTSPSRTLPLQLFEGVREGRPSRQRGAGKWSEVSKTPKLQNTNPCLYNQLRRTRVESVSVNFHVDSRAAKTLVTFLSPESLNRAMNPIHGFVDQRALHQWVIPSSRAILSGSGGRNMLRVLGRRDQSSGPLWDGPDPLLPRP